MFQYPPKKVETWDNGLFYSRAWSCGQWSAEWNPFIRFGLTMTIYSIWAPLFQVRVNIQVSLQTYDVRYCNVLAKKMGNAVIIYIRNSVGIAVPAIQLPGKLLICIVGCLLSWVMPSWFVSYHHITHCQHWFIRNLLYIEIGENLRYSQIIFVSGWNITLLSLATACILQESDDLVIFICCWILWMSLDCGNRGKIALQNLCYLANKC